MSRIYWLGVRVAVTDILHLERGGAVLTAMLQKPGVTVRPGGFPSSRSNEPMTIGSLRSTVCFLRSTLTDAGFPNAIKTTPHGYLIEKIDAERMLAFIEDLAE